MSEQSTVTEISLSSGTPFAIEAVGGTTADQAKRTAKTAGMWSLPFLVISAGILLIAIFQGWDLGGIAILSGVTGLCGMLLLMLAISSYKMAQSVSEVRVTCSRCGHTESMLASWKFLRCRQCNKLMWLPRCKEETSAVAHCPICGEANTLPAGGTTPVKCPNCYALLHVAPNSATRLAEADGTCSQCGARVAASSWMCPQCLIVLREEVVPSAVHPTDKEFINGIGPTGALAAAAYCLAQARAHLREADLAAEVPENKILDDFSYPYMASFYLFRAGLEPLVMGKVLRQFAHLDEVYALLLLRLYFLCHNLSEDRHQHFLKPLNNRIAGVAFYRMRCELGLQQQGLIVPQPPVNVDRWLAQLPVKAESRAVQQGAAVQGVFVETVLPGLGALSYITRERDRVLLQPDQLRCKSLELLGASSDLTGEQLEILYRHKLEASDV